MSRHLSFAVLVLLLAAGCKRTGRAEEEARKVTPTSTDDATKDLDDEDYRFRLSWPGTGWKVLREKDARHLNPEAIAGLTDGKGVHGIVIVEHLPGATLAAFADAVIDALVLEDKTVAERAPTKVSGIDAIRLRITGKNNDFAIEFRGVLLVHQDHAYQMLAFTPGSLGKPGDLDKVVAAFSIEPGTVKAREVPTAVDDQAGVGWRITNGVFESAAGRLRVRPAAGWKLLVNDELDKMNTNADVGMSNAMVGAYVTVISEPITDVKSYIAGRIDAVMADLTRLDESAKATIIGKEVTLVRARREGGMPLEFIIAVLAEGGRGYQFIAWYPTAKRDAAEPIVLAALGAFERLSAAELAALTAELGATPDRQNFVGSTYALRARTYLDFDKRLRWRMPPGFWKLLVGQEARATNADVLLAAHDVVRGLQLELIAEPAASLTPDAFYSAVENHLVGAGVVIDRRGEARLGSSKARLLEGKLAATGLALRYRVTVGFIGGLAIQLTTWAAEPEWPDDAAIDTIASGIEVVPSLVEVEPGSQFKDHRLGYAIGLPQRWRHEDVTPASMKAIASMQQWKSGSNLIMVIAIFTLEQHDDAWLIDLLEQTMRGKVAALTAATPKTSTAKLAGRDARHVIWRSAAGRADLLMLERDATLYAVLAVSSDGSQSSVETARDAFKVLD